MIASFFPLKKMRRNGKYLLFGAILVVGVVAVYHEMVAARAWSGYTDMSPETGGGGSWRGTKFDSKVGRDHQLDPVEDSAAWRSHYTPQIWKPEYKGRANLHIFEDWCGSSTADLRKNMHYPLYPHSRTTVQKLAVSPQWTNYGLRIFGYLHPYTDGEFVFAVSSDDNSEFWLSTDETPPNTQLLAWVGKTGAEWTAPGEFEKYSGQTSRPVRLSAQRRYFFEVIHKQNDNGNDHVEVAWQLLDQDLRFKVIESKHISLYVNESALLLSDIAHIPQTAASYRRTPVKQRGATIDMLREDPRDTFFQVPLINSKFLQGVLPDCQYKPSYTIKDFPLLRYQGLQFVHMSYIYPNDYTRLTHMETQDSCFYPERPYYMKMFGFSRFMKLDRPDTQEKGIAVRDFGFRMRKLVPNDEGDEFGNESIHGEKAAKPDPKDYTIFPDYGDDYDDYAQRRRRKLFSLVKQETNIKPKNASGIRMRRDESQRRRKKNAGVPQLQPKTPKPPELAQPTPTQAWKHLLPQRQNRTELKLDVRVADAEQIKPKRRVRPARKQKIKLVRTAVRAEQTNPPVDREPLKAKEREKVPQEHHMQRKTNYTKIQRPRDSKRLPVDKAVPLPERPAAAKQRRFVTREAEPLPATNNTRRMTTRRDVDSRMRLREKEIEMNMPLQQNLDSIPRAKIVTRGNVGRKWPDAEGEEGRTGREEEGKTKEGDTEGLWGLGGDFEGTDDEDLTPAPVFDMEVNWNQTFQVSHLDLQAQRSDWIDLQCNISGNLMLQSSDVGPIVEAFMDHLNKKHNRRFTLVRVINVVKRVDGVQGSRYLLELELKDKNGQLLRLTRYVYALLRYSRQHSRDFGLQPPKPEKLLCNPVGFQWNPTATVHIIVPVKNQARWVQQLITDMEQLFRVTRDTNFNLIITDYNSTDMDVRKALQKSSLPRYQYVKLSGNFERSAGLQAGVDLISDSHSIVFLCDLHIHFPSSIIDTIRKHCVEGHMAFAPIVMRLNCGSTPLEARGYWEVNGFGLLGIYKSDLDALGGMNTREFRERWGGEDWELLDRILQAGLEVERIYLKNFFHHYHSKRGMWNHQMPRSHR